MHVIPAIIEALQLFVFHAMLNFKNDDGHLMMALSLLINTDMQLCIKPYVGMMMVKGYDFKWNTVGFLNQHNATLWDTVMHCG